MKGGSGASLQSFDPGGNDLSFLVPLAAAILEKVGRPNLKLQLVRETCTGPQGSSGGHGLVIPSWGHGTGTIAQLSLTAHC